MYSVYIGHSTSTGLFGHSKLGAEVRLINHSTLDAKVHIGYSTFEANVQVLYVGYSALDAKVQVL